MVYRWTGPISRSITATNPYASIAAAKCTGGSGMRKASAGPPVFFVTGPALAIFACNQ